MIVLSVSNVLSLKNDHLFTKSNIPLLSVAFCFNVSIHNIIVWVSGIYKQALCLFHIRSHIRATSIILPFINH